jgi:hypothetical protein
MDMYIINDTYDNANTMFKQILPHFKKYDYRPDQKAFNHVFTNEIKNFNSLKQFAIYKLMFCLNSESHKDHRLFVYAKLINITKGDTTETQGRAKGSFGRFGHISLPDYMALEFEKINIVKNNSIPLNKFKIYINQTLYPTGAFYTCTFTQRGTLRQLETDLIIHILNFSKEEQLEDEELSLLTTQKLYMTTRLLTEGLQKIITEDNVIGIILDYFTHSSNYGNLLDKQLFDYVYRILPNDSRPRELLSADTLNIIESSPLVDSVLSNPVILSLYNILKLIVKANMVEHEERRIIKEYINNVIRELFRINPKIESELVKIISSSENPQTKFDTIKNFLLDLIKDVMRQINPHPKKSPTATIEEMGPDEKLNKYLKYKSKYLELKNKLI